MAQSPKRIASAFFASIDEKNAKAKESALYEIKELRKDLLTLEKILSGKQKAEGFSPIDLVHGAFEIYRHTAALFEHQILAQEMEQALEKTMVRGELEKLGATLLKKPEGWHWISPQGEMHHLGPAGEEEAALEKLKTVKSARRKKAPAKKKSPAKKKADAQEPEAKS